MSGVKSSNVMPAFVVGIHPLKAPTKDVDGRNKSGHDDVSISTQRAVVSVFAFEPVHHVVELIEATIANAERAAALAVLDRHRKPERIR